MIARLIGLFFASAIKKEVARQTEQMQLAVIALQQSAIATNNWRADMAFQVESIKAFHNRLKIERAQAWPGISPVWPTMHRPN